MSRRLLLLFLLVWLVALLAGAQGGSAEADLLSAAYVGGMPRATAASIFVTDLGGWQVLTLVGVAAALALISKRRYREAVFFSLVVIGGRAAVELQKLVTARARPEGEHLVLVHNLSFPSGHAANATITYLAAALLLFGTRGAAAAALVLAAIVGMSRVALGVHWPSDVVGGWAFGLLWTLGLLEWARRREVSAPPG